MQPAVSAYLDLARLTAAAIVVVVHAHGKGITGGFLWQVGQFGQAAVMVFFVLSGYVIAHVTSTKERSLTTYLIARASRLLSVVIPALLLTLACNELGPYLVSPHYRGPWHQNEPLEYLRYVLTLFMVQDIWDIGLSPTNNGPFWSISFEFVYYMAFAAACFLKGAIRWITACACLMLGGPTIAAMFPIWLLGWWVYRVHSRGGLPVAKWVALLVCLSTLAALTFSPEYRSTAYNIHIPGIERESIIGDYVDALLFSAHLLLAPVVLQAMGGVLIRVRRQIAAISGITFALYLFHQPLVRLFAGVSPFIEVPGSAANIAFVYLMTVVVVVIVGIPAERWKRGIRTWLEARVRIGRSTA